MLLPQEWRGSAKDITEALKDDREALKCDMCREASKSNGEPLKNEKAVLKRANDALKGDRKVLNGIGMP